MSKLFFSYGLQGMSFQKEKLKSNCKLKYRKIAIGTCMQEKHVALN